MKYDDMSLVDIIDDYGRVRGDLCEQYARDQLVSVLNRHVTRAVNEALIEAADAILERRKADHQRITRSYPAGTYRDGLLDGRDDGAEMAARIVRARIT